MNPMLPTAYQIYRKNIDKAEPLPDELKAIDKFVERYAFVKAFVGFEITGETKLNHTLQSDLYRVLLAYQALAELFIAFNKIEYSEATVESIACGNEVIFEVLSNNEQFSKYLITNLGSNSSTISAIKKGFDTKSHDVVCYAKAITEIFSLHKSNSRYLGLGSVTDQRVIKDLSDFVLSCCDLHFLKYVNSLVVSED